MGNTVHIMIKNCMDCPHHEVKADPDPSDWFNDDDQKIVCKKRRGRAIATAVRPYNLRKESEIPDWCPLLRVLRSGDSTRV